MSLLDRVQDRITGAVAGAQLGADALSRALEAIDEQVSKEATDLQGLADLALDSAGWQEMTTGAFRISLDTLRRISALSRFMYLLNPLIHRAVTVQELYVWGSGYDIKGETPIVNEVLDDFFEDPKNQQTVGAAWPERERDQRIDGNTFFVFYVNKANGRARVRIIPVEQIVDIVCNPEDAQEPWYYKRAPAPVTGDHLLVGQPGPGQYELIPCIQYTPFKRRREYNDLPINWDACILHVKTGGLTTMKFGVPELFSVLNWATAYKTILENFASILAAYARLAMKVSGLAGTRGVAAAKNKLGTGISGSASIDRNPPTNTASWMMLSGNVDVQPVKTAKSTTGPDEARALRSMVAAGTDTPEHFFGDSDVGNFATSETLDRPTELKMVSRQRMWTFVILTISAKLIEWSATAPNGKLRASGYVATPEKDPFDGTKVVTVTAPAESSTKVTVEFPTILERDVTERVRAVVNAATLNGRKAEGIFPDRKLLFKYLLVALGEKNADYLTDKYYPAEMHQGFVDPADELKVKQDEAEAMMKSADASVTASKRPVGTKPAAQE